MNIKDLKIGNWVYYTDTENENPIIVNVSMLENIERMDKECCKENVKVHGIATTYETEVKKLRGIPLEVFLKKNYKRFRSILFDDAFAMWTDIDKTYYIVKKFYLSNGEPYYAVGVHFFDSTLDEDKETIHEFMWGIKYVHELQNILSSISNGKINENIEFDEILKEMSYD